MLASEVITFARDTMLGFDTDFVEDAELLRRLSAEQRKLLEELLRLDNMALTLPGDDTASTAVAVYAASYALDADWWRLREAWVTYSTGTPKPLKIVPSNWRHAIPAFQPCAYIIGTNVYPIDGGSTRIHGWTLAATIEWRFVHEPTDVTDGSDAISAPDEALPYLGHFLAHYMGVRGKVAAQTLAEIKSERDAAKVRLMGLAKSLPGADQFPPNP